MECWITSYCCTNIIDSDVKPKKKPEHKVIKRARRAKSCKEKFKRWCRSLSVDLAYLVIIDNTFNKKQVLRSLKRHMRAFIRDPNKISFSQYKLLSQHSVSTLEIIEIIFDQLKNKEELIRQLNIRPIAYIFTFAKRGIYTFKEIIKGINKYVQIMFEIDCKNKPYLNSLLLIVYLYAIENKYCKFDDIHLFGPDIEAEHNFFNERLKLAVGIMDEYDGEDKEKLRKILRRKVKVMIEMAGKETLNKQLKDTIYKTFE